MPTPALRKNGYVVLKGRPCKIIDVSTSGNTTRLVGLDVFTGKKYEDTLPAGDDARVPTVSRTEYAVVGVEDGHLYLMTTEGVPKDGVRVPAGDLGTQIEAAFESGKDLIVSVLSAMGEEAAVSLKELTTG